jgi:hypothetical protein
VGVEMDGVFPVVVETEIILRHPFYGLVFPGILQIAQITPKAQYIEVFLDLRKDGPFLGVLDIVLYMDARLDPLEEDFQILKRRLFS